MFSQIKDYAFINASLRTKMNEVLSDAFVTSLASSDSIEAALVSLRETPFSNLEEVYQKSGDLRLCELSLFDHLVSLYKAVLLPLRDATKDFVEGFILRLEIIQLKNIIRLWFDAHVRGRAITFGMAYLYRGRIIHSFLADDLINNPSPEKIVELLKSTPYAKIFEAEKNGIVSHESLFAFEIALDRFYFGLLGKLSQKLSSEDQRVCAKLLKLMIDSHNLNLFALLQRVGKTSEADLSSSLLGHGRIRLKDFVSFSTSNQEASFSDFVSRFYGGNPYLSSPSAKDAGVNLRALLDAEMARMKMGYPFSIRIILAYLLARERENRRIVSALNSCFYEVSHFDAKDLL